MPDQISLKDSEGKLMAIDLLSKLNTTIKEIKCPTILKIEIGSDEMTQLYRDIDLDENATLNYFGIKTESLLLFRRNIKRGDGYVLLALSNLFKKNFAESAPDFRIVIPGLNLGVRCEYCKKK